MAADDNSLDDLRREIDRIDDQLHDLLMRRTEVATLIGGRKRNGSGIFLRPGREAEILRRLIARHHGAFPKAGVVRLWREIMGTLVRIQGPFSLAVYMPSRGAGYLEMARDQYGTYSPTSTFRTAGQVVRAVADGDATVGIVPLPDVEGAEPWWISLAGDSPDLPRIISRLPFAGPGEGRGDNLEALAIACLPHDSTGFDRTWLAVESSTDVSRTRLKTSLGAAGLEPSLFAASHATGASWLHLVEISSYVAPDDERLTRLVGAKDVMTRAVVLGGYAVPFAADDLND